MKIFDLTIDYERSPLGVDEAPLLCWKTDIPQESYAVAVTCGGESVYAGGTVRSARRWGFSSRARSCVRTSAMKLR